MKAKAQGQNYILDTLENIIYIHIDNKYIAFSNEEDIETLGPWKPLSTSETLDIVFSK
jgi:hypothetical protein